MYATNLSLEQISRRAGGRRRYNAERQEQATARRLAIVKAVGAGWVLKPRGLQTRLAEFFGVDRATICRDFAIILDEFQHSHVCLVCHTAYGCRLSALAMLYRLEKRNNPVH